MTASPETKLAGVLAPLFALRTEDDLGIGDVATLRQFIDWAGSLGFKIVQLLPINEIGGDNSPYNAISAVALEPTTLHLAPDSPRDLTQGEFDEVAAEFDLPQLRKGPVNYERVRALKLALLEKAFAAFARRGEAAEFEAFRKSEAEWLDNYTLFRALMNENGNSEAWDQWRDEHRSMKSAREWLNTLETTDRDTIDERMRFFAYVQWIAREQWIAVRRYAEERGVALMGDIPFGVSYYSADVFGRPDEFALDWFGGAPPEPYFKDDDFTQKWGQNWGIPLYRWDVMRQSNLGWWRQRVAGVRHIFHIFRIDHVLGFYRIYAFPWRPTRNAEFLPLSQEQMLEKTGGRAPHFYPRDDETTENAEANRRDGEEYLRVVLQESGATRVVGEDLGTVPKYVRPSLRSLEIAGFKIPQWEVYDNRVTPGSEYDRLSVATYATHDHQPIRAVWSDATSESSPTREQSFDTLQKIALFSGFDFREGTEYLRDFYPAIMRALFASNSGMAIVMITDLLARKDRFNVPGTAADSNWSQRMHLTVRELSSSPAVQRRMRMIRRLLRETGRA
ncbi:MAG: 4-alpha-glucanotransferase [Chthoniobacterales bacterium]